MAHSHDCTKQSIVPRHRWQLSLNLASFMTFVPSLPIRTPSAHYLCAPLMVGLAIAPAWMPDVSSVRRYVPFSISTLIADKRGAAKPLFFAVANP